MLSIEVLTLVPRAKAKPARRRHRTGEKNGRSGKQTKEGICSYAYARISGAVKKQGDLSIANMIASSDARKY